MKRVTHFFERAIPLLHTSPPLAALLPSSYAAPPLRVLPWPASSLGTRLFQAQRIQEFVDQLGGESSLPEGFEMLVPATALSEEEIASFNPFKRLEKQFQLHRECLFKMRKGKMKLHSMRVTPTDFSSVVDLSSPVSLSRVEHTAVDLGGGGFQGHRAFFFPRHPGLYIIPGALDPSTQQGLARRCLDELIEPPARTNHYLNYGYFSGLFRASRELVPAPRRDGSKGKESAKDSKSAAALPLKLSEDCGRLSPRSMGFRTGGPYAPSAASDAAAPSGEGEGRDPIESLAGSPQTSDDEGASDAEGPGRAAQQRKDGGYPPSSGPHPRPTAGAVVPPLPLSPREGEAGGTGGTSDAAAARAAATRIRPYEEAWVKEGKGPTAAKLLNKLRWATMGPQFDWDRRVYDPSEPHRAVPQDILSLAIEAVRAVREAWEGRHGRGSSGLPPEGCYRPDVALMNVYREGDTLNGHVDDVEDDLSLPIVTLSLGCEAIFLMGFEAKEAEPGPTPVLLRTGDLVIMGGAARRCYHGVPRILPERGVPAHLDPRRCPEDFRPYAEYFAQSRINISVRSTQEPQPERVRIGGGGARAGVGLGEVQK